MQKNWLYEQYNELDDSLKQMEEDKEEIQERIFKLREDEEFIFKKMKELQGDISDLELLQQLEKTHQETKEYPLTRAVWKEAIRWDKIKEREAQKNDTVVIDEEKSTCEVQKNDTVVIDEENEEKSTCEVQKNDTVVIDEKTEKKSTCEVHGYDTENGITDNETLNETKTDPLTVQDVTTNDTIPQENSTEEEDITTQDTLNETKPENLTVGVGVTTSEETVDMDITTQENLNETKPENLTVGVSVTSSEETVDTDITTQENLNETKPENLTEGVGVTSSEETKIFNKPVQLDVTTNETQTIDVKEEVKQESATVVDNDIMIVQCEEKPEQQQLPLYSLGDFLTNCGPWIRYFDGKKFQTMKVGKIKSDEVYRLQVLLDDGKPVLDEDGEPYLYLLKFAPVEGGKVIKREREEVGETSAPKRRRTEQGKEVVPETPEKQNLLQQQEREQEEQILITTETQNLLKPEQEQQILVTTGEQNLLQSEQQEIVLKQDITSNEIVIEESGENTILPQQPIVLSQSIPNQQIVLPNQGQQQQPQQIVLPIDGKQIVLDITPPLPSIVPVATKPQQQKKHDIPLLPSIVEIPQKPQQLQKTQPLPSIVRATKPLQVEKWKDVKKSDIPEDSVQFDEMDAFNKARFPEKSTQGWGYYVRKAWGTKNYREVEVLSEKQNVR